MDENNVLETVNVEEALEISEAIAARLHEILLSVEAQNKNDVKLSLITGMIIGGAIGVGSFAGGLLITKKIQEYQNKKQFEKMSKEI